MWSEGLSSREKCVRPLTELYDVVLLPGVPQPMALGFKTNEIDQLLLVVEPGSL